MPRATDTKQTGAQTKSGMQTGQPDRARRTVKGTTING